MESNRIVINQKATKNTSANKFISYSFLGVNHEVHYWREMLFDICDTILKEYGPSEFEKVLKIGGFKRRYFSKDPTKLRTAHLINGTNIYVELNLSAIGIKKLCNYIVSLFGYEESDFKIDV